MFSLVPQFSAQQLDAQIKKDLDELTLQAFIKVSERAIQIARERAAAEKVYDNHTGNLESSTGFIVIRDGRVEYRDFKLADIGTDKSTGLQTGLNTALSVLRESKGWAVILVAGMEYASWVEGKGFDVLSGAMRNYEQYFEQALNEIFVD
ncbi:hypothetical protein QT327_10515 [Olivibacter sp. 47]|uniref:hypothetical protein n=1 Tax=Olivibacter sp. 47 TaxID=3056486 RepID=UPI0025A4A2B8|nr:hypothetical protein [Olivibacter sp. 47]MDM8174784.1 hypothetical protein [Olivibacter sp. 47]